VNESAGDKFQRQILLSDCNDDDLYLRECKQARGTVYLTEVLQQPGTTSRKAHGQCNYIEGGSAEVNRLCQMREREEWILF